MSHTAHLGEFRVTRAGLSIDIELADGGQNPEFIFKLPPEPANMRVTVHGHSGDESKPPLLVNYDIYRNRPGTQGDVMRLRCFDVEGQPFDFRSGRIVLLTLRPVRVEVDVGWEGSEGALRVASLPDEA